MLIDIITVWAAAICGCSITRCVYLCPDDNEFSDRLNTFLLMGISIMWSMNAIMNAAGF